MATENIFDSTDVPILSHAVSIFQNLEYACYATKLASKHLKFPIKSHADISPLFDLKGIPEKFSKRKIQAVHLKKFFPKEFFPIDDPADFLGKTLAALSWGDTIHYHERFLKEPQSFSPMAHLRRK